MRHRYLGTVRFPPHDPKPPNETTLTHLGSERAEAVVTEAPHVTLAVAQFYERDRLNTDFTGWVVSGQSSDLYTGPITSRKEAFRQLELRTVRELRLYKRFPDSYPKVPVEAFDPRDRIRNATHLPD
ncbi:hypothetical protein OG612_45575 (plasmid) [Streptomyces sp. NBC_01527]|uniref:hypothetical protein n=1 Tax=Streptomyces sp. NBC_01527 TaxID=2903894 RepID=UPI002F91A65F